MKSVAEDELVAKEPPDENTQPTNLYKQFEMFAKRVGKELFFVFIITCTTYATLINLQSDHDVKGPSPKPFFHGNLCVEDYYQGNLNDALSKVSLVDLAVLMFYAPWDADSIESRQAFEEACLINKNEVYFGAVNCWQPESVCNKLLKGNKIYPMIVAYDYKKTGVPYVGPLNNAAYLTRFIHELKRPVQLLSNKLDLVKVHRKYHNVLVASVDFKTTKGWDLYSVILDAAIKHLKSDPLQMYVKWCVATWPINNDDPMIRLHLWNRTLAFNESIINDETLVNWILRETRLTSRWIPSPGRSKTQLLDDTFKRGPVMILFTPQNPYLDLHPTYSMLQALSIEYFNCGKNNIQGHYINKYLSKQLKLFFQERPKQIKECYKTVRDKYPEIIVNWQKKPNATSSVGSREWETSEKEKTNTESNYFNDAVCKITESLFFDIKLSYCFKNEHDTKTTEGLWKKSGMDLTSNYVSTDKFVDYWNENDCYRALLADKYFKFSKPQEESKINVTSVLGLACKANKSMTFIALDSNLFYHVAKGFGINLNKYREKTAALIYDQKTEMVHILPRTTHVTKESMAKLLTEFLDNQAKRHLRSSSDPEMNFHSYNGQSKAKESIEIQTLNSENFKNAVFNNTENVVVYFYTPICAYCQVVAHVLLTVARLMRNVKDLKFFRINGSSNDLSWHLAVQTYPTVIIFPAKKKAESYIFPYETEITSKNLSQFILSNLSVEARLLAMIGLCTVWDSSEDYSKHVHYCLREIKLACDDSISKALQSYRRGLVYKQRNTNVTITPIFNRLRYLKAFSLVLDVTHKLNAKSMLKFGEIYNSYLMQS
ncbi:thioredoxin domain-containing protein 11 [Adelges cooleyi]|uniref:thioredoxin domain-containing protein 11 n=1 Tax=Adelges cooleyi TaxID=133065 RepID=UPI00217F24C9|nr:thioredoxin domain-containing protein 11 [Adelges cooleyi]